MPDAPESPVASIADALCEAESDYAPGIISEMSEARRVLDRLAADGFSVVRTEPLERAIRQLGDIEHGLVTVDNGTFIPAVAHTRRGLTKALAGDAS